MCTYPRVSEAKDGVKKEEVWHINFIGLDTVICFPPGQQPAILASNMTKGYFVPVHPPLDNLCTS